MLLKHDLILSYQCFTKFFPFTALASQDQVKGIVSPDWKGLHMFSLDRFEV
jgi:hypothetical protein